MKNVRVRLISGLFSLAVGSFLPKIAQHVLGAPRVHIVKSCFFFEASCVSFGENTNMLSMVISKQSPLADHARIKLTREN